ncbi:MAG: HAD family phosphatase [Patescibacteria group bacterium]
MIKAIIFDLDGVFVTGPKFSERFMRDFGISASEFMPVFEEIMSFVKKPGSADLYNYWQPYLVKWKVSLNEEQFLNYWFGSETIVPGMVECARELKARGMEVIVLSNNFRERSEYYQRTFPELFSNFDQIYFSWQTGFRKPDKGAYRFALTQNHLNPSECLFFDDSERNVEAASELGINAFLYEGPDHVKGKTDEL